MLVLAIDTSATASAALVSEDGIVGRFSTEDTRSHAEVLAPGIQELLASTGIRASDIDAVITGVGPGPFTGLRSGIATARTLAYVWDKPLHGAVSLDAIALEVAESEHSVADFLVVTDARRKEVYWARYSTKDGGVPHLTDGPHVSAAGELPALPAFGAGAGLFDQVLAAHPAFRERQPDAAALGRAALMTLAAGLPLPDSTPLYLRESDAQVPGPRKRAL